MSGHRVCRPAWFLRGFVFNGALLCLLASFSPLVLAADWVAAAKVALPSTVRVYSVNGRTGETCEATGIVIDKNGVILTAAHAVEGFTDFSILIDDDIHTSQFDAVIIKTNLTSDLALLQAEGTFGKAQLPAMKISDVGLPVMGYPVAAIGNPLKAFRTLTAGIVSAAGDYQGFEYILFDARIEKGSSGGPLINERGELVGVVVEILRQNGTNMGKALSTGEIKRFMAAEKQGFLGIGTNRTKTGLAGYGLAEGLIVTSESTDTPFELNDIIMTFKDYPMNSHDDLVRLVRREQPGSTVEATILRNGEFKILKVSILDCPAHIK